MLTLILLSSACPGGGRGGEEKAQSHFQEPNPVSTRKSSGGVIHLGRRNDFIAGLSTIQPTLNQASEITQLEIPALFHDQNTYTDSL